MKHYTGIDLIEIVRVEKAIARWGERFLRRIYTESEIRLYGEKPESLAARFACKEAVMKLLGKETRISWLDIETLSRPGGQPFVNLHGGAKSEAERLGLKEITASIAHSREYAIASVIGTAETD